MSTYTILDLLKSCPSGEETLEFDSAFLAEIAANKIRGQTPEVHCIVQGNSVKLTAAAAPRGAIRRPVTFRHQPKGPNP